MGIIKIFAGNFAPQNWMFCTGQLLPINQYNALFALLGTTYGGDGKTTFGLPDLRGRAPIGYNMGTTPPTNVPNLTEGAIGGTETQTLTINNMPAHTHAATVTQSTATLNVNSADASIAVPTAGSSIATPGSNSGRAFASTLGFNTTAPNVALNSSSVSLTPASVSNATTGTGTPINTMPPYLGISYIICVSGLFPPRP